MAATSAPPANLGAGTAGGRPRVVVIGGGFGGLAAVRALHDAAVDVTLIDRTNHHLFQPLLYQVATGALSPANIASPLRGILRKQRNARVILGAVTEIDVDGRTVRGTSFEAPYDILVIASGARHHYFGHDAEWEQFAPGLKTIADATDMRRRILGAFERAEEATDPDQQREWLTFVVVGAGPTGVELAGALGEIARDALRDNFRTIDPGDARIYLLEGVGQVLPSYHPKLARKAQRDLERLGVEVQTETLVTGIEPGRVTVRQGAEERTIAAHTVLWAAGVQASPLGRLVAEGAGAEVDRAGRVIVQPDLSVPGHPEVLVVGDLARVTGDDGEPLPGVAPVAIQQGQYAAARIRRGLTLGGEPFHYRDRGKMATIGRGSAVAEIGPVRLSGLIGWFAWLGIHLFWLTEFENRLLVFTQWAWNYLTKARSARLIIGRPPDSSRDAPR
ncbi:MAG: NAD(P)/FAD-dependent oxidoreductase [Dehalococcoidia bacterium]|nr:NAD(P)/FAD-dependent oxidoreductase [Dehalococcoidia bacterium]